MSFADFVAAADRAAQVHLGGVPVVYQPEDGDPVTVQGLFDEQYLLLGGGEAGVEQAGPAVFLLLEDLATDPEAEDATLTINGRDYHVRERQPDGVGGIRLLLYRVGS